MSAGQSPAGGGEDETHLGDRTMARALGIEGLLDSGELDYRPDEETDDDEYEDVPDEEEDEEFRDAEDGLGNVEVEFEIPGDEESEGAVGGEGERQSRGTTHLNATHNQIIQALLSRAGFLHFTRQGGTAYDEDSENDTGYGGVRTRRGRRKGPYGRSAFEKVPSEAGRGVMEAGKFGTNERLQGTYTRKRKIAYRLAQRELANGSRGQNQSWNGLIKQSMIPRSMADMIIHYNSRCYSGQFSDDGNFFFSCAQDLRVRMYDTSNPYDWKYYKTADFMGGRWTITDASLSPDNRFLAYSSIQPQACLASTDPYDESPPQILDFVSTTSRAQRTQWNYYGFGIWSLRFSGDGREIVAGTGDDSVYVYDVELQRSTLKIPGHNDDVNAVCYGDKMSPHVLYSGSDDTTLKVWDRRSMGDGRPAGVFFGHTEGLTYVDSKGDGRYVLSNAKDQTAKLWDLRKMMSAERADQIDPANYTTNFEYRSSAYDEDSWRPHPHDCSLVTFRGHSVLRTLIRCHFAPPGSADSAFVYSGSYDGSVYIWNMDATLAGTVDVFKATKGTRPRDSRIAGSYDFIESPTGVWQTCVRDASWHPSAPVIAATSWNGWGLNGGTCTVHSWNDGGDEDEGEPKSVRVNDCLEHDEGLYTGRYPSRRSRFSRAARRMYDDDDD
ncbi:WD40-repeat-containing domain protein [Lineolata rhizophorae]|uniref:WD40-repeat-containing domain protein n=1 Tax=Lineolata rhizophorae TaxID=578093 RepID=A0A6A6P965_9PEZI|nr:WD40-repeat-containing domain protein [Lineolata rhizophorae]